MKEVLYFNQKLHLCKELLGK